MISFRFRPFLLLVCSALAAQAEITISDSFTLGGGGRVNGASIQGLSLESSSVRWQVINSVTLTATGTVSAPKGAAAAAIFIPPGAKLVTVEADVKPTDQDWVCVAFGGPRLLGRWWDADEGVQAMLIIRPNGGIGVFVHGTSILVPLSFSRAPAFKADGFNRLQLTYDAGKNTLSAKVNGESVLKAFDLTAKGFTPVATMAGFYFNTQPQTSSPRGEVDNFKLTVL